MKLEDLKISPEFNNWVRENPVLVAYIRQGKLKSQEDITQLHRSYSPYRVPRGLTGLQIRRRINKFVNGGCKLDSSFMNTNRVSLLFNGTMILGASTTAKRPENSRQMNKLLRDLLAIGTARKHPLPKGF